jgi:ribosome-associated protein
LTVISGQPILESGLNFTLGQAPQNPYIGSGLLDSTELARTVVDLASEKLAEDIVMLDLRQIAPFADYFIIMSAESARQIEALEQDITRDLKQINVSRFHREGTPNSGWVLLDFSDVVIHIFSPEERETYDLERLWSNAPQVVRIL